MIEAGGNRSTESFDFGTGDIWVYGANEAHMVQGHKDGCTYLAGALQSADTLEVDCFSHRTHLWRALDGSKLCAAPETLSGY